MTTIGVLGTGMTGAAAVGQLCQPISGPVDIVIHDTEQSSAEALLSDELVRISTADLDGADVVILASPAGCHVAEAESFLNRGVSVVSVSDSCSDVDGLLDLSPLADKQGLSLAVGVGFAPGLTCLLARFAGDELDAVQEISVSKVGTGGPACARQHHSALKSDGLDWIDQNWLTRSGGSGRDLAWFPGEIGAHDCYRGALSSPRLLQRRFASATRISARVSATRRDRLTSRLPMLRPPHRDGGTGAARVEVRGWLDGGYETRIYGAAAQPSLAAGTVAAVIALAVLNGATPKGAFGLAELDDCANLLNELRNRGLVVSRFYGSASL